MFWVYRNDTRELTDQLFPLYSKMSENSKRSLLEYYLDLNLYGNDLDKDFRSEDREKN